MWPLLIVALILLLVILIVPRLREPMIHIPRSPGDGDGNAAGYLLHRGICPACGDDGGFYSGGPNVIYCGNRECRVGFEITNYGNGKVKAEPVEGADPRWYT